MNCQTDNPIERITVSSDDRYNLQNVKILANNTDSGSVVFNV